MYVPLLPCAYLNMNFNIIINGLLGLWAVLTGSCCYEFHKYYETQKSLASSLWIWGSLRLSGLTGASLASLEVTGAHSPIDPPRNHQGLPSANWS